MFAANLKLQRNQPTACATISCGIVLTNRRQGWLVYYLAIKRENNMAASNLHFVQGAGVFIDERVQIHWPSGSIQIIYSPHTRCDSFMAVQIWILFFRL